MAKAKQQSTGAGLVFLLGLVLVGTGVGFATAPHYSWQVMKIAKHAANLGLQNGALVVGGLVLFGLAIVARRVGSAQPVEPEDNGLAEEVRVLNEQLTAKLAQMRAGQLQLSESVAAIAAEQQAQSQRAGERAGPSDQGSDALFRLAASLDKLNAHLDERIHSIDLQLRSGMETLANELRRSSSSRVDPVAPAAHAPFGTAELGTTRARPQPQVQMHAPEGAIDFYETMQKLDAIAGDDAGLPSPEEPPAPFGTSGGSTLDTLLPEDYRKQY